MEHYTREQRHEHYLNAKSMVQSKTVPTICAALVSVIGYQIKKADEIYTLFPEFASLVPKDKIGAYVFPLTEEGRQQRIELLDKCIEMTKPE